ncbi:lipoprotein [Corynebacterium argentoratense]
MKKLLLAIPLAATLAACSYTATDPGASCFH